MGGTDALHATTYIIRSNKTHNIQKSEFKKQLKLFFRVLINVAGYSVHVVPIIKPALKNAPHPHNKKKKPWWQYSTMSLLFVTSQKATFFFPGGNYGKDWALLEILYIH